jgi:PAS domain-containing protein
LRGGDEVMHMLPVTERQWAAVLGRLKMATAKISRSKVPIELCELLDQAVAVGDSLLQELAGTRVEFESQATRLKHQVSEASDAYLGLFDELPIASLETDPQGNIVRANRQAALLLNTSPKYLAGRTLRWYSDRRDEFDEVLRSISGNENVHRASLAVRPKERAPVRVELRLVPGGVGAAANWIWFFGSYQRVEGGRL